MPQAQDYRIQYDSIVRVFLLPKTNVPQVRGLGAYLASEAGCARLLRSTICLSLVHLTQSDCPSRLLNAGPTSPAQTLVVISLDPPIRKGQTFYNHILCQVGQGGLEGVGGAAVRLAVLFGVPWRASLACRPSAALPATPPGLRSSPFLRSPLPASAHNNNAVPQRRGGGGGAGHLRRGAGGQERKGGAGTLWAVGGQMRPFAGGLVGQWWAHRPHLKVFSSRALTALLPCTITTPAVWRPPGAQLPGARLRGVCKGERGQVGGRVAGWH